MLDVDRKTYLRFAVGVALACYELPADRVVEPEAAAKLVKWVIDMAKGPDATQVTVEPMRNYPPANKFPLVISICGVAQHLLWFYPQQPAEEMCNALAESLSELPVVSGSVPA